VNVAAQTSDASHIFLAPGLQFFARNVNLDAKLLILLGPLHKAPKKTLCPAISKGIQRKKRSCESQTAFIQTRVTAIKKPPWEAAVFDGPDFDGLDYRFFKSG
jgi:hypothetical protein